MLHTGLIGLTYRAGQPDAGQSAIGAPGRLYSIFKFPYAILTSIDPARARNLAFVRNWSSGGRHRQLVCGRIDRMDYRPVPFTFFFRHDNLRLPLLRRKTAQIGPSAVSTELCRCRCVSAYIRALGCTLLIWVLAGCSNVLITPEALSAISPATPQPRVISESTSTGARDKTTEAQLSTVVVPTRDLRDLALRIAPGWRRDPGVSPQRTHRIQGRRQDRFLGARH